MDNVRKFTTRDTSVAKGVAILLMLFHHCFLSPERYEGLTLSFAPISENFCVEIAQFGKICIGIFAFLSAYGMMKSYRSVDIQDNRKVRAFLSKRLIKMMTGFWAAYIVGIVGSCIIKPSVLRAYGGGVMAFVYAGIDALGLADLFGTKTLLGTWWYMSFAILLILLFPLLEAGYRKMGGYFAVLLMFLPYFLDRGGANQYTRWLGAVALGMLFADLQIFEKISKGLQKMGLLGHVLLGAVLTAAWIPVFLLRGSSLLGKMETVVDGSISAFIVLFVYIVLSEIPLISTGLAVLGKHSMNIYLIHNFIRVKWFYEYTYSYTNVF